MKFCHVTISVRNLNESMRFYQNIIGLSLRSQFTVVAGFEVESISETLEFLHHNEIEPGEIIQLGPQARCLFISDPNGIKIQLIEYFK